MAVEGEVNVEKISFIRNVYSNIIFQLLVTAAVVSVVVLVLPVDNFPDDSMSFYVAVLLAVFMSGTCCIVHMFAFCRLVDDFHQKHLLNHFLLLISYVSAALPCGFVCAIFSGKILLETFTLTTAVVISLSLYIYWAAKRNEDISFLVPSLYGALLGLILASLFIQSLFPLGKLSIMVYGCLAPLTISYIALVHDIGNLIKGFSDARYIRWLSVSLYLDAIFVFASLVPIFAVAEFIKKKI